MGMSRLLLVVAVLLVSLSVAVGQNPFIQYGTQQTDAHAQFAALPVPLTVGATIYPAGTFILLGANFGAAILPPASGSNPAPVTTVSVTGPVADYGVNACANRAGSNRFYFIGTAANAVTNMTNDLYYVVASNDGVVWQNVLDAATTAAWKNRFDDDYTMCVVDLSGSVYSVGSTYTWKSSNLGVTFNVVAQTGSRFSNRTYMAGGIFTSALTQADKIIVIGGRQANTVGSPYGGNDLNDVWITTNFGASWTQQTSAASWVPRDEHSWAATSNGVMVIYGGAGAGGYYGYYGDMWTSTDEGVTWQLLTAQASFGNYSLTSMIIDSSNYIYIVGGETGNANQYNWSALSVRSTDNTALSALVVGGAITPSSTGAAVVASTGTVASPSFFFQYGTQNFAADSYVTPLVTSLTYNATATASAGSFLIYGGPFGSAVLASSSASAATASATAVRIAGSTGAYYGSVGCGNRAGSNRFYLIGTPSSASNLSAQTGDLYSNFASNDGVNWADVLDAGTKALWRNRFDDDFTMCVVDLSGNVYSVGSASTWKSSNQGVTFSYVSATSRFSNRTYFAGGIFTSTITGGDKIMVIAGRQANTQTSQYGGSDLNDVWMSTTFGASWSMVSTAPFTPRDSSSWAASSTGTMVLFGGASEGGYFGYLGDLWSSVDDGVTWQLVAGSTSIGPYCYTSMVFDSAGYLYLFGGQNGVANQYNWSAVSVRSINTVAPASSSKPTSGAVATSSLSAAVLVALLALSSLALL